jgi:hypothetical protein
MSSLATHDFNNLLTAVMGNLEIMELQLADEELRSQLRSATYCLALSPNRSSCTSSFFVGADVISASWAVYFLPVTRADR